MLNRNEIIELVEKSHGPITDTWWDMDVAALDRFAEQVVEKERKKQAKAFEEILNGVRNSTAEDERLACIKVCKEVRNDFIFCGDQEAVNTCIEAIEARGAY
jgi:hypothetical protein